METIEEMARSIQADTLGKRQVPELSLTLATSKGAFVLTWEGAWRVGLELKGNYKTGRTSYSGHMGAGLKGDGSFGAMEESSYIATAGGIRPTEASRKEIIAYFKPVLEEAINAHKDFARLYFAINFNESVRIHTSRARSFGAQKTRDEEGEGRRISNVRFEEDGVEREQAAYVAWLEKPPHSRETLSAFEKIWGQSGTVAYKQRMAREALKAATMSAKEVEEAPNEIEI